MAKPSKTKIARTVLQLHPKSRAGELRIDLGKNTPGPLYQWLVASLLFSARISAELALKAAKAVFAEGWRTPQTMAATSWETRVTVLNHAGYARYDESTARYIADTTALLLTKYGGDLRKLREAAERKPDEERRRLKAFKGIGDVGADIFFREMQTAWDELYPFADERATGAAHKLGLGSSARELARLVPRRDLPRLLSGLVRIDLAGEVDAVLEKAA